MKAIDYDKKSYGLEKRENRKASCQFEITYVNVKISEGFSGRNRQVNAFCLTGQTDDCKKCSVREVCRRVNAMYA